MNNAQTLRIGIHGLSEESGWRPYYRRVEQNPPSPLAMTVVEKIRSGRFRPKLGLDLGSGTNTDACAFLEHGLEKVVSIDACLDSVPYAMRAKQKFGDRFEFHNMPIEAFCFEDSAYDLVYSNATLHFMGRVGALATIEKMVRALRQDGLLAITLKGTEDWVRFQYPEIPLFQQWEIREALFGLDTEISPIIKDEKQRHSHLIRALAWKH